MPQRRTLPPDICYLCLSGDRKIFCLSANIRHLFGFITNWYPQSDARVCWECRATLERLRRFKEQAKQAVCSLERARTGLQPMDLECLSKTRTTEILIMDSLVYDEPNEYATEECEINVKCGIEETEEYSSGACVKSDDYINKKSTLEEILDSGGNKIEVTIDDNETSASHNEVEQENNDLKLKSIKTIDLSSDDTIDLSSDGTIDLSSDDNTQSQSELTIQDSIEHDNMSLDDVFHVDATTASADGESVSQTDMDELVERAKRLIEMKIKEYRNKKHRREQKKSKIASVEADRLGSEHVEADQLESEHVEADQLESEHVEANQLESEHVEADQLESEHVEADQLESEHVEADQLESEHVEADQLESEHVEADQLESEQINSPISTFAVDALPSSNAVEMTNGILETRCQNKELISLKIIKKPGTSANPLVNENRGLVKQRRTPNQRRTRFECYHCDKVFTKAVSIARHLTVHFKRFMCDRCAFVCNERATLSKHMLRHLDASRRPYECDECNKRFMDKSKLFAHRNIHTSPHKCDVCGRAFVRKSDLTAHLKYYTSINTLCVVLPEEGVHYKVTRYSDTITYECNICKERFEDLEVFCKHYKYAHKMRVACTECTKTFKCRSVMMQHVDVVHRGIKSHLCYVCGMKCTTKERLKAHMGKHSNEKPFKCNECSAKFKYSCVLYTHKLIHKGEKRYQCDICEARFAQKGNLVGHMKIHTRDRSYECEICGKKFAWMRNLKNHLKIHSKEQQYLILLPCHRQPTGIAPPHC